MRGFRTGAVNTAPNSPQLRNAFARQRKRDFEKIPASPNVILEAEEFTKNLDERMNELSNSPNAKIADIQRVREYFFRSRSIALGLHAYIYDGNEDLSHCKIIADTVKHCEKHCPEVSMLWFGIPIINGIEKSTIRQISKSLLTKIKNENHGNL
jgi:hypothetical protein